MGQTTAQGAFGKFNNAHILFNAVDLSSFARSLSVSADNLSMEEISAMGDTLWSKWKAGRYGVQITIEFWEGYYTSEVHETLEAAQTGTQPFNVAYNPEGSTSSATNKRYTWSCFIENVDYVRGEYDQNLPKSVTLRATGAPTIATS